MPWPKGKKKTQEQKEHLAKILRVVGVNTRFKKGRASPIKGKKTGIKPWLGKKRSEETKKKISQSKIGKPNYKRRGENHPFWRGGVTPINQKIRTSLEYKLWRKTIFERDNYQCIWGGKVHGNNLNADHIKPFSLYPELRFSIDNGRTLCAECHKKTDTFGGKLRKKYKI